MKNFFVRISFSLHSRFLADKGTEAETLLSRRETSEILASIHEEFVREGISYAHKWQLGDFIISDNLAIGHEASPETQKSVEQVGLRVMHRVTIAGKERPSK